MTSYLTTWPIGPKQFLGREPWSSGYGRRLTFWRWWVQIAIYWMDMTFFAHWFVVRIILLKAKDLFYVSEELEKNCIVCLKRPKINEKEAGVFKMDPYLPTCFYSLKSSIWSKLFNKRRLSKYLSLQKLDSNCGSEVSEATALPHPLVNSNT